MSTDPTNYYKNLWTERKGHGTKFFQTVDFNIFPYKYQEKVFREYLRNGMYGAGKVEKVLELGAGKGRMSNILLEEFDEYIKQYDVVDIHFSENFTLHSSKVDAYEFDITSPEFNMWIEGKDYDLILASEVFLHIKPEDIENVICTLAGNGKQIINIDWTFEPNSQNEWCFIHPYHELYTKYGGKLVNRKDMKNIQQSLFHYRFGA